MRLMRKKIAAIAEQPKENFREQYGIDENTLHVYTGRLIKEKGIFKLIQAVEDINSSYKVCLFIAGDGEELEAVKNLESNRVKPLGRLELEQIASLLGQVQIYCLTNRISGRLSYLCS